MRSALLLVLVFTVGLAQAQNGSKQVSTKPGAAKNTAMEGYEIKVKLNPLKQQWIYLYNYYGDKKYQVADSVKLNDKSEGVFKGKKKLHGGIYLVVTEKRVRMFDLLMDDLQHFSIAADTANPEKPIITGSKENTSYQEYAKFLEPVAQQLNNLQQQLAAAKSKEDSATIVKAIEAGNKALQDYRENVMKKHPGSMLTAFFNAMKKPEVPAVPKRADGSLDSAYPYRYVQQHFWDDVELNDDRLVRTPFFEPKLEEYYKFYVSPDPDSVIAEVKYMLLSSRAAKEMYRYLLAKFTNKYMNSDIMGQDKVFVYLFENHYLKGDTTILSEKDKEIVFKRGWSLIANIIGKEASPMMMNDTAGKPVALYDLRAPFTFVVFWDPNCGHCKTEVPRIDSIYHAKWKALGVKIFAVNVEDNALPAWKEFINKHKLKDGWTHVYEPRSVRQAQESAGQANFRQLYDVYKTPTLYLLDSQKRIIAKHLDVFGFDQVLNAKLKLQTK
jgi:thiol-disulfide isomerase/thioredoxin